MAKALEQKRFAAELKADVDSRVIEGYAAVFGNVDNHGDRIERGAFRKTIAERFPKKLIKVFDEHGFPVGMPDRMEEDARGLYTVSRLERTPQADLCLEHCRSGVYSHMSIGYYPILFDTERTASGEVRILRELKLMEYSAVMWPANEEADILAVKAADRFAAMAKHLAALKRTGPIKSEHLQSILLGLSELLQTAQQTLGVDAPALEEASAAVVAEPSEEVIAPELVAELHAGLTDLSLTAQLLGESLG